MTLWERMCFTQSRQVYTPAYVHICAYVTHPFNFTTFHKLLKFYLHGLPPRSSGGNIFLHLSPSYFFPPTHLWYVQFRQTHVKTGEHWWDCFSQVWERKSFPMKTSVSVQVMPSYPPKEMFWLTFFFKS